MLKVQQGTERTSLGFTEAVRSGFKFLVEEFSFACVKEDVTLVRFESTAVFVNVYHGRSSYELSVEIGELPIKVNAPENSFTLGEILQLVGAKELLTYRPYQVTTLEAVAKFVQEIAILVKQYAPPALIGDHDFFMRLSEIRVQRSDSYLKKLQLNRVRTEVETAWHQKNYGRVVELYESIQDDLTPVEAKKFEYAKNKHLS